MKANVEGQDEARGARRDVGGVDREFASGTPARLFFAAGALAFTAWLLDRSSTS